jgi:hypothetical protein
VVAAEAVAEDSLILSHYMDLEIKLIFWEQQRHQ